ncbi:hypothetical protein [Neotabrizicola sp. sgz301269]|uniref:hypothetical protein n=1 Tax=Neotabrizicola sp. sgz301269 TaxID=3276282 RepID=UPI0037702B42
MRRAKALPPLGLVVVLASSGLAGWQVSRDTDIPITSGESDQQQRKESVTVEVPTDSEIPVAAQSDAVFSERPLLVEGRRAPMPKDEVAEVEPTPIPEPEPAAEPEAIVERPEPLHATLIGVAISESERSALIRFELEEREEWVRIGDAVGAWRLAEITQQSVRLEAEGEEMTLSLYSEALP